MAGECSSSSGTIQGVRPAGEAFLQWVGVQEEEGVPPEEVVGEVEEASCPQGAAGEVGTYLQKMVWVEEAEGRRGGRGEGLQEQQLPVSAGRGLHNLNTGQEETLQTYRILPDLCQHNNNSIFHVSYKSLRMLDVLD